LSENPWDKSAFTQDISFSELREFVHLVAEFVLLMAEFDHLLEDFDHLIEESHPLLGEGVHLME